MHLNNVKEKKLRDEQQQDAYDKIEAESRALEQRYRQQAEQAVAMERARLHQQQEQDNGLSLREKEIPGIARRPTEFDNSAFHDRDPGWQIVGSRPEDMEPGKAEVADQRQRMMQQRRGGPVPGTMGPREISLARRGFDEAQDDPNASSI